MPAHQLKGLTLDNGWTVSECLSNPTGTGGHFSVSYLVTNQKGETAFLKALDYSKALQSDDPARALQEITQLFNFERDVLTKCKGYKLSRVVVPIESGKVSVNSPGPQRSVEYIIFQKAAGDLRNKEVEINLLNSAWCLRCMHQAAVGLQQLHSKHIIHQDIKPSNVLFFPSNGAKVSDLGTSFDQEIFSPRSSCTIAGAVAYAPLDRKYSNSPPALPERIATDIYLLGSLFFYFFCGISATQAILTKLRSLNLDRVLKFQDFEEDLPYIETAFSEAVADIKVELINRAPNIANKIEELVVYMCHPNPKRRGLPSQRKKGGNQFDMYRFVSMIDLVATKAELSLK